MVYNIARRVLAISYHFNSPEVGGGGGGGGGGVEFTLQKLDDGIQPMSTKTIPKIIAPKACAQST